MAHSTNPPPSHGRVVRRRRRARRSVAPVRRGLAVVVLATMVVLTAAITPSASALGPMLRSTEIDLGDLLAATPGRPVGGQPPTQTVPAGEEVEPVVLVPAFHSDGSVHRYRVGDGSFDGVLAPGGVVLQRARAVAVGDDGLVYVADADGDQVLRFEPVDSSLIDVFVSPRSNGLSDPRGLAFGPDGNLVVASAGSGQLLEYDGRTGEPLGVVADGLHNPGGLVFTDDGHLIATSQNDDTVHIYADGELHRTVDVGPGAGPVDVAIDPEGMVFVALVDGGRVDRVDLESLADERADSAVKVDSFVADGLVNPSSVAVGPDGALWVADQWTDQVLRVDRDTGQLVDTIIDSDTAFGPSDLVFYPDGSAGPDRTPGNGTPAGRSAGLSAVEWLARQSPPGGRGRGGLRFEANDGRADPDLDFVARGRDYGVVLAGGGAIVSVARSQDGTEADTIRMGFVGAAANLAPQPPTSEAAPSVVYDEVYPGIDLTYRDNGGDLEYLVTIDPGADPEAVAFELSNATDVELTPSGSLRFRVPSGGGMELTAPVAYQDRDGTRVEVDSRFEQRPDGTIGFEVGAYDPALPLIIDPTFRASTSADSGGGNTITIARPAGVTVDDVLLASIAQPNDGAVTPPAGWTLIRSDTQGTLVRQDLFYKIASGSEPASYVFTLAQSAYSAGVIVAYDGVDTANPIDAHGGQGNTASTSYTAPSITTTSGATLVGFFANTAGTTTTSPAGMSERADHPSAAAATEIADEQLAPAGPTGTRTATGTSSVSVGQLVALTPVTHTLPMAVYRESGQNAPRYQTWDGASFGGELVSATVGEFRIIQGAESPSRDEAIVVGVDAAGTIAGELWDGSAWTALPALGSTTQTYWWGFDVAYEAVSGDAVVVYADGSNLNYRVWNGSAWSGEASITEPLSGTPRQMQLASHPSADEMVLVVSDDSSQDYAVVWDGTSWGNPVTLHSGGAGDRTDIYVAYEQQSGRALAVFGTGTDDVHFRLWDGSWSSEFVLAGINGGYARWTTLASDPNSDNIVMGVLDNSADVWLAVWNGSGWVNRTTATTSGSGTNRPVVAVAFEGISGQAMAAYSVTDSTPEHRTWTSGTGWSAQANALDIGGNPNSVMLYANSLTDEMMLATQDSGSDLNYTYWDGGSWVSVSEVTADTGETKNQPFLFLWNEAATPPPPAMSTVSGTVFEDVVGDVLADGAVGDAINPGAAGVDVYLYEDDGNGTLDAGDSLVGGAPVQTDANGAYSFAGLLDGDYFVVVDSKTVGSSQDPAAVRGDIWAEQTYGPAGGYCDTGVTFTVRATAGPCYGGISSNISDDFSQWDDREHRALVTMSGADASNVDFGFSFNVVTTTNGGDTRDDDTGANRTVQGSLRQFIQNANAITGANTMRFVPADPAGATDGGGNSWWRISVTSALPVLTDASTTVDGRAYNFADGVTVLDTNTAALGTAGSVGVGADGRPGTGDEASIATVGGPELEIADGVVSGRLPRGIDTDADDTTIRRLAIWGFGSTGNGDIQAGGDAGDTSRTGFLLEDAVVGATPVGGDPGAEASVTGLYADDWSNGAVRRSYLAHTSFAAARFWVGLPNWIIEDSHFESNGTGGGIQINNTGSYAVARNRFVGNGDSGLAVIDPPTSVIVTDNTFDGNTSEGAAIGDINGSTVARNLFENNTTVGLWIGAVNSSVSDNTMRLNGTYGLFVTLGTSTLALDRNLIEDNGDAGARLYVATGVTMTDNQVTGSGATGVLVDGSGATLTTNTITGNIGPGVVVKSSADGITLDRNVFGGNGGIAIDLSATTATLGDGVTVNTATPPSCGTDLGVGNGGLDTPVIDDASATTVTGRACAGATVQVYRAVADGDGSDTSAGTDYGEGVEHVGTTTADGSGNWSLTGITGLIAGDAVTATATKVSQTSEFSANLVTNRPPVFDQNVLDRSDDEASWISLSAAATDPDLSDTLVYSATGLPLGLSIDADTGLVSGMINHAAAVASAYSVEISVSDGVNPAVTDVFTWTVTDVPTSDPYLVAGTGGTGGGDDLLTTVDPAGFDPVTNEVDIGTGTGTSGIRAAAIEPLSGVLYAVDGGQLGTLDVDSGVFTAFDPGLGTGDGEFGAVIFDDVRGLAFHPLTGVIWAVHVRPGLIDVLFQIDPATGANIPDAFGAGVDYIKLRQHGGATDYTGLAIDPTDWQLYGVVSDGAGTDHLVSIRTGNGNARVVGTLAQPLTDISFDSTGQLWGIDPGALYQVSKTSGILDAGRTIDNGAGYGALAFAVPPANPPSFEGTVFEDTDGDALATGQFPTDPTNPGAPGVTVNLYQDDGTVAGEPDTADTLFDTKVTGPTGKYFFEGLPDGTYYVVIDSTTVGPSAGGSGWAEQTYGPAGAATFDGSYSYAVAPGPLYGGRQGAVSDDQTDAGTAEHLARLDLTTGVYIEDVDFGFSFNVVTNLEGADATSAQGSLRRFIDNANAITGPNTMRFVPAVATNGSDGGGSTWWSLAPTVSLPVVTDADTVLDATAYDAGDGTTTIESNAPGPELELNGSGVGGTGLELAGTNGEVRRFVVNRFGTGIALTGGSANTIAGNYIGTGADGVTGGVGNIIQGVLVDQSPGNLIGGISAADRNIISGNRQRGIAIDDWSDGAAVTSGGTQIINNYIGVDRTGAAPVPYDGTPQYQQIGVYLLDSSNTAIGMPSTGNVISGNPWYGIYIWGSNGSGNVIQNNIIGLDSAGSGAVPNGTESSTRGGVCLSGTVGTLVGGAGAGEGNTIAANGFFGLVVSGASADDNAILGNSVYGNGDLGIGLDIDGVTVNDVLDVDSGANGLLNYPVLAAPVSGETTLDFELDVPAGDYRVEVFANPTEGADPSGFGEGETLLAAQTVTHTGAGPESFLLAIPAVSTGDVLSATATEDLGGGSFGATSEFSAAVAVGAVGDSVVDASVRRSDVFAEGGLEPVSAATGGTAGTALTFGGGGDLLRGPGLNITDTELSVSAWIRPAALGGTDFVVSKRTSVGDPVYELGVDGSGQAVATLTIGGGPVVVQGGTVTAGMWHHVAVTWDGATVRLHVDGSEVDTAPASGSLSVDASTDVIVGNRSDGTAGFNGEIDHVEIGHTALTAAEVTVRYSMVVDQSLTVLVGQQQTDAAGAWTVSGVQSRSGGFAMAAPETADSGAAAWAVASGVDEPGVVFETWWWASTAIGVDLASGTRTGRSPTDQFEAAYIGADTWDLRRRSGAVSSVDGSGTRALTAGSWVKVEQWTDQNGNSRLLVDGVEVAPWTAQTAPPAGGSLGVRVGQLPNGRSWYVDDPRARRLVMPEPTSTLGPLDRD